jgi:hypothetical protein
MRSEIFDLKSTVSTCSPNDAGVKPAQRAQESRTTFVLTGTSLQLETTLKAI